MSMLTIYKRNNYNGRGEDVKADAYFEERFRSSNRLRFECKYVYIMKADDATNMRKRSKKEVVLYEMMINN